MNGTVDLLIDGVKAVLPSGYSHTITEENPFFSKRGQYSLDIELSMLHPVNAKIFGFRNRTHATAEGEDYTAVLLVDGRLFLSGTAVVVGGTENTIKLQLLSGSSDFNYISSDAKIREMDLGTIPEGTDDMSLNYPDIDFHYLPFITGDGAVIGNYQTIVYNGTTYQRQKQSSVKASINAALYLSTSSAVSSQGLYDYYRPQPYLCAIIRRIVECLGFELDYNALASDAVLKELYLVHGYNTRDFAKMLPDWTVDEFFSQLEGLYDVSIVVNPKTKTASLFFNYHPIESDDCQEITVIDEFEDETDDSLQINNVGLNIGYSLDDKAFYNLTKLDKSILDRSIAVDLDTMGSSAVEWLLHWNEDLFDTVQNTGDADRFKKIFYDTLTKSYWITWDGLYGIPVKRVNCFRNLIQDTLNSDSLDFESKIIPAQFQIFVDVTRNQGPYGGYFWSQMPVVDIYDPFLFQVEEEEEEDYKLHELVSADSDATTTSNVSDKMYLAVFCGIKYVDIMIGDNWQNSIPSLTLYPFAAVETLPEYYGSTISFGQMRTRTLIQSTGGFPSGVNNPFRLDWLKTKIYDRSASLDLTRAFKFKFFDNYNISITDPFLINNKKYLCSKIERTLTEGGFNELAVGTFYKIEA